MQKALAAIKTDALYTSNSCPACSHEMSCGSPLPGCVMASKRRIFLPILAIWPAIAAVVAVLIVVILLNSGDDSSQSSGSSAQSSDQSTSSSHKPAPPVLVGTPGNYQTIATYLKSNNIPEVLVHRNEPGAPVVTMPMPPGWA